MNVVEKAESRSLRNISVVVYVVLFSLLVLATVNGGMYDLVVDKALFNPESVVAKLFEDFGQAVTWAMWGPAFAVVFICRRDLNGDLVVINSLVPAIKPINNTQSNCYKFFDFCVKTLQSVGFFILCVIGWKKLIENVIKNILADIGKENFSQPVYFIISFAVAVISILLLSRVDKKRLQKFEGLALAGILLGITFKLTEECKTITHRVRFREMVAYSNGYFNDEGLSEGRYSPLTKSMVSSTDFGAFSPWFKKSADNGIYDYHLYNRTDSFPSGHTVNSCMIFLLSTVFRAFDKLKKFAPAILCVGVVYTGVMGYTRLIRGAHYLSDVVAAFIIGYTLFLAVNRIYCKFSSLRISR